MIATTTIPGIIKVIKVKDSVVHFLTCANHPHAIPTLATAIVIMTAIVVVEMEIETVVMISVLPRANSPFAQTLPLVSILTDPMRKMVGALVQTGMICTALIPVLVVP